MILRKIKNIVLGFLAFVLIVSCTETVTDNLISNKAPDTFIFIFNDGSEINKQKSRLKVHWWGDDPDGLIAGYFIKWEGIDNDWTFTTSNDSVFSLPIGSADTNYVFKVFAADDEGNGKYDNRLSQNGTDFGAEPFLDANANGSYDEGEKYFDIGLIDPTPASQDFPIKNSTPVIEWNDLSVLPPVSFPVMTVGWNASDLDGDESITKINIALNDTTEFVSLDGFTRIITLIIDDLNAADPKFRIYVDADDNKLFSERLQNLNLDGNNRLYLQAEDISGAKSSFIPLPDTTSDWFIEKPKGDLLIIDDYQSGADAKTFYENVFDNIAPGEYNTFDIENSSLPYTSVTLTKTIELFDFVLWYSDPDPSLDLASLITQDYLSNGGKIAFSMNFKDSSASFNFSTAGLQIFLPIDSLLQEKPLGFLFPGATVINPGTSLNYPNLKTSATIGFVRTFAPNTATADAIYDIQSNQINGNISFMDKNKSLYFIGLPLHQCDGNANVDILLNQIFINDFGLGSR
ncbi:MAG: hypothetical protein K9I99_05460 [Melioribacteraceae bacterium]|nr:hypothetical protein [Melioribacteraceae bacterium]